MAKMTHDDIRTAGRAAKDAYYEEGFWAGKKIADQLKGDMIRRGNTSRYPAGILGNSIPERRAGWLKEPSAFPQRCFSTYHPISAMVQDLKFRDRGAVIFL